MYLFTGQLLGVGWIIDLFILGGMVDRYKALYGGGRNVNTNTNMNNIVVNIPSQGQNNNPDVHQQLQKIAELKEKGLLTEEEFNAQKAKLFS